MKKNVLILACGILVIGSLCACGKKSEETKVEKMQEATEEDVDLKNNKTKDKDEKKSDEKADSKKEKTTESKKEVTTEAKKEETTAANTTLVVQTTATQTPATQAPATQTPATQAPANNEATSPVENDESGADSANVEHPGWPEVVNLVNSKGDTATAYLLAEGNYMDRICMVYTYDGNGTWTDTNGVEWSKAAE